MTSRNEDREGGGRTITNGYGVVFRHAIAAGHLHDDFASLSQFTRRPA